ncbi:MAG: hypothetical protein HPY85_08640 [Anaerolineae bacterium]|jgi:hypothetical protein|nr:hypothetical protein [Anaerolineae bacterium]
MSNHWTNPITRVRRNHALEHATLAILQQKGTRGVLGGISGPGGFWLFGNIDPTLLQEAVEEALQRLRRGEHRLAVSPNCGTNFAVPGALGALAAWVVMLLPGKQDFKSKLERLPLMMLLVTLVLILSRPLAKLVQERLVTDPNPGSMKVTAIMIYNRGGQTVQHIQTRH